MSKHKGEPKDRVASFRISRELDTNIEKDLKENPITGCDTANKFYRKLALDYLAGRLLYKNPEHRNKDPEVLAAEEVLNGQLAAATA